MAARLVRSWRGIVRGNLKIAEAKLTSLLAYNTKHPTVGFLTTADVLTLTTAQATMQTKLAATKPR